jgi:hypothetical protein
MDHYIWEHYSSNNALQDYQGGYAVRNLVGGIAPSLQMLTLLVREHLLGVFQINIFLLGFFISGRPNSESNTVLFLKNSQRLFVKEDDDKI